MSDKIKDILKKILSVIILIVLWQAAAFFINQKILLASPIDTLKALAGLMKSGNFYITIGNSFLHILAGFGLGLLLGAVLSYLSFRFNFIEILLWPFMEIMRATPVASFIILCLIWLSSKNLSIFIVFIIVIPIVYSNLLSGFKNLDKKLVEMADSYDIKGIKRFLFIYLPQLKGYIISAFEISIGLAFKSGIAAEVIGTPAASIGKMLYNAKIYLETPEIFAWTIVIIILSMLFTTAVKALVRLIFDKLEIMVWKYEPESEGARALSEEGTNLENVGFSYESKVIFDNFSENIKKGEKVVIMAPSGRGKTTLLKLICGFEKVNSGKISGTDGKKDSIVFQEERLIEEFTAAENIMLGVFRGLSVKKTGEASVKELIEKHLMEIGIEDAADKKISELSGGMKRRVEIVKAILSDSDMVVLDEAFSGLDIESRKNAAAYINRYINGRTLIMVSHEKETQEELSARVINI